MKMFGLQSIINLIIKKYNTVESLAMIINTLRHQILAIISRRTIFCNGESLQAVIHCNTSEDKYFV